MENDNNVNENLNDNSVLNALVLTGNQWRGGIAKAVIFTLIAVVIFFIPITIRGNTDVTFGIICKDIKAGLGLTELWMGGLIIMGDGLTSIYGKYLCKNKDSTVYRYYQEDSALHPLFYLLGSIFALTLVLRYTFPTFEGPATIVSPNVGETVYSIAMDVAWIIPVSAVFMPFLLSYGIVDFIGSLMELLVRPVFEIPGRNVVDTIASFVSSTSMGILVTSKLYQRGIHTKKEAALIATGFNAVSVGFTYEVIETADLSGYFLPICFVVLLATLVVSFFMARIPPLSRKTSMFADGRQQIKEEIRAERVPARAVLKTGASGVVKKAATAPGLFKEIRFSLLDSCYMPPKAISLLTAVGIIAVLIVAYTPVFNWIGKLFAPLFVLLQVLNATEIAPVLPVGIAEMSLPVLMIIGKAGTLAVGVRYMVATVSMMQIIFFSEAVMVMMSAKIPISLKELVICFFERTIVAIPISALFMHLLF